MTARYIKFTAAFEFIVIAHSFGGYELTVYITTFWFTGVIEVSKESYEFIVFKYFGFYH